MLMAFQPGHSGNPAGRPKGARNQTTKEVKAALELCFERIGGDEALAQWARRNRGEFYALWARLLPKNLNIATDVPLLVVHDWTGRKRPSDPDPIPEAHER